MNGGIYSPEIWDKQTPANVLGGINRAKTAERDRQGRFLPKDAMIKALWSLDPEHGKLGGKKRAATAKREKGKFACAST